MRDVDIVPDSGQFFLMNTMSILLGATFALLLAAVVLSFQNMNQGVKNAPADELARLKRQVDQLSLEQERWKLEKQMQELKESSGQPDTEAMKAELAAKEAEIAALAEQKLDAEKKASTYREEATFIGQRELEKADSELLRARRIRDALLIARVSEVVDHSEVGNFVIIEIIMPDLVKAGDVLAIRRNSGILGRLKVTEISPDGAIASPLPGFGPMVPQQGDELIIPPQI
ncbi:MAG: hypothetical protein RL346_745 [Verrucomicrobiota bacterium]